MNVRKETSRQLRNAEAALFRRRQEKIESIRRKKISLGDYLTGSAAHLIDSFKKVTSKLPRGVEVWLLTRRNALLSLSLLSLPSFILFLAFRFDGLFSFYSGMEDLHGILFIFYLSDLSCSHFFELSLFDFELYWVIN